MTLFFFLGVDDPDHGPARRGALRAEHSAYVRQGRPSIVLASPLLDGSNTTCGSLLIFEMNNEGEVHEWLEREPFHAAGVYKDVIVRRFVLGQNRLPLRAWPDEAGPGAVGGAQTEPGKSLFAFVGLDHPPHQMAKRDALRAEHRAYVKQNREPLALAGAVLDKDGNQCASFNVFEAKDEQEVRDWRQKEPFFVNSVYKDVFVFRIQVAYSRLPLKGWPDV